MRELACCYTTAKSGALAPLSQSYLYQSKSSILPANSSREMLEFSQKGISTICLTSSSSWPCSFWMMDR